MKTEILDLSLIENMTLSDTLIMFGTKFPSAMGNALDYLSDDEIRKYDRLKISEQSNLQKSCRAVLKILLGKYTSLKTDNIRLKTNRFGKPYLENTAVWFNVSHTDKAFIIAISLKGRIGVDMEALTSNLDFAGLVDYTFSEEEKKTIHTQPEFLKHWTLKEALLKAVGTGLTNQLTKINTPEVIRRYSLQVETFDCPGGEIASVISNVNFERTYYQLSD